LKVSTSLNTQLHERWMTGLNLKNKLKIISPVVK
jgi:hypothetical protein